MRLATVVIIETIPSGKKVNARKGTTMPKTNKNDDDDDDAKQQSRPQKNHVQAPQPQQRSALAAPVQFARCPLCRWSAFGMMSLCSGKKDTKPMRQLLPEKNILRTSLQSGWVNIYYFTFKKSERIVKSNLRSVNLATLF